MYLLELWLCGCLQINVGRHTHIVHRGSKNFMLKARVYNRKREGEYPTPYTAVQTHCG